MLCHRAGWARSIFATDRGERFDHHRRGENARPDISSTDPERATLARHVSFVGALACDAEPSGDPAHIIDSFSRCLAQKYLVMGTSSATTWRSALTHRHDHAGNGAGERRIRWQRCTALGRQLCMCSPICTNRQPEPVVHHDIKTYQYPGRRWDGARCGW